MSSRTRARSGGATRRATLSAATATATAGGEETSAAAAASSAHIPHLPPTPSRSTAASIYAPTPLRTAALTKSNTSRLSLHGPRKTIAVVPSAAPARGKLPVIHSSSNISQSRSANNHQDNNNSDNEDGDEWERLDDDEEEEEEEDADDPHEPSDSAPIASRTRTRRQSRMNSNNSNPSSGLPARRSLLAPPSLPVRRPSSALGKRRAEHADSDSEYEDASAEQGASRGVSEFGMRKGTAGGAQGRSGIPAASAVSSGSGIAMDISPPPAPSGSGISRLARAPGSPSKAGALLNSLRAASPLKSVAARQLGAHLGSSSSGSGSGTAKSRIRTSLGSLGAFTSSAGAAAARKSGLRPPSAAAGAAAADASIASSTGSGHTTSGSLPRPRKLSRPSTMHEVQYARATLGGPASTAGGGSALPKPRMGSNTTGIAAGKRGSLQAPPDSFAKMVVPSSGGSVQPPASGVQAANASSSSAAVPPSASTFRFAMPSGSRPAASSSSSTTRSTGLVVPSGSTPLRSAVAAGGLLHPAVASLRPPQPTPTSSSSTSGLLGVPQGKLSKMLLPTPDARERGKKRLSGMSLGSNTSMSSILAAAAGSGSSSNTGSKAAAAKGEQADADKENQRVGGGSDGADRTEKGKKAERRDSGSLSGRASPSTQDWHVLQQLRTLAEESGLSLQHLRALMDSSVNAQQQQQQQHVLRPSGSGASIASSKRGLISHSARNSVSGASLPRFSHAPGQSTPAAANRGSGGAAHSTTSLRAFSPAPSDTSMLQALGTGTGGSAANAGAGAVGEETIDLVNMSLSPPGSTMGSPLAAPADDSLMMMTSMDAGLLHAAAASDSGLGDDGAATHGNGEGNKGGEENDEEDEGESDMDQVESPLLAIAALRPESSHHRSASDSIAASGSFRADLSSTTTLAASSSSSSSARNGKLVAGPLSGPASRARRSLAAPSGSRTRLDLDEEMERELGPAASALGFLSSPGSDVAAPTTALMSEAELKAGILLGRPFSSAVARVGKTSTDSEGTARGSSESVSARLQVLRSEGADDGHALARAAADEVTRLKLELEEARNEAARQRDLHELKLAEYESALEAAIQDRRGRDAGTPKVEEGAVSSVEGANPTVVTAEDVAKLQARIEALQAEQTRSRKLYELELAGLEEACRGANERASQAEAERVKVETQAAERARLDEEARHALGEEAERAMMALVDEREQAKAEETRLREELEHLRATYDTEGTARTEDVARLERELEQARAELEGAQAEVERERAEWAQRVDEAEEAHGEELEEARRAAEDVRHELEVQEGLVVEALGDRRRVLGQSAARAWGDLADVGRNEMLLLDGKADMCHFLLAQLDLWDSLVQSCYPPEHALGDSTSDAGSGKVDSGDGHGHARPFDQAQATAAMLTSA
ncbi:hypothetical protein OC834_006741 [Tilletia horrida]|nr:hypothetical protein OC834_006741 [Tilletia horrida]